MQVSDVRSHVGQTQLAPAHVHAPKQVNVPQFGGLNAFEQYPGWFVSQVLPSVQTWTPHVNESYEVQQTNAVEPQSYGADTLIPHPGLMNAQR